MNKIKLKIRELRFKCQRIRYGYSDADLWELYNFLITMMVKSIKSFRNSHGGHPAYMTNDEWDKILDKITDDLSAGIGALDILKSEDFTKNKKKFERGMKLLTKNFFDLWD